MSTEANPYFQHDELIGHALVEGELRALCLRLHVATERYARPQELFPLRRDSGTRSYVHARPYTPIPQLRLPERPLHRLRPEGRADALEEAHLAGMRRKDIGHAQAWYYPQDQKVVLWECFLNGPSRSGSDPARDELHRALWRGFEQSLTRRFPHARQLMTTWEDLYDRGFWQRFLEGEGYRAVDKAAFGKAVPASAGDAAVIEEGTDR